jgi:hypothetical protein
MTFRECAVNRSTARPRCHQQSSVREKRRGCLAVQFAPAASRGDELANRRLTVVECAAPVGDGRERERGPAARRHRAGGAGTNIPDARPVVEAPGLGGRVKSRLPGQPSCRQRAR